MKSLDEFVALFAEQFDDTDASEINAETCFHELDEWSSLLALSIIAMVDSFSCLFYLISRHYCLSRGSDI